MGQGLLTTYSNLLLRLYRLAQDSPVAQFQDQALAALQAYLPFDSSMWGTATMEAGGIDIHHLHLYRSLPGMLDAYARIKHLDTAATRVTAEPTLTLGFHVDEFAGEDNQAMRQFLHDYGHRNFFISSDINPLTRFVQWVSLYREDGGARCTPAEIELLGCLAPHLMQALAINRLAHMDRGMEDPVRVKWAVAIADQRGVIYHADPRFTGLVDMAWPAPEPQRLAPALLAALTAGREMATREVVLKCRREHGLLFLKARRSEAVDTLSEREYLVARLIASGLTLKQVAARLERSPETVRSQSKAIFSKLGIGNVAMLGALLAVRE